MTYLLHEGAEQDLADAIAFYTEYAGHPIARRFLAEFERVAELLAANPGFGTPTARARRAFPLKVFPYSVVYHVLGSDIRIMVVRHQHRRPTFGGSRR